MIVRKQFRRIDWYPSDPGECAARADEMLAAAPPSGMRSVVGGVAPHAGWVFAWPTAARVFRALKDSGAAPETIIFFGAVHAHGCGDALFPGEAWETPLGRIAVDAGLGGAIMAEARGLLRQDAAAHAFEHSVDNLLPLAVRAFPGAKICVVSVDPELTAVDIGAAAARAAKSLGRNVAAVASTDLSHYGPSYGFAPVGTGEKALRWVKEENDAEIIERMKSLDAAGVIDSAARRHNACGAGAAAAAVSFAVEAGAKSGVLLHYTTSFDVFPGRRADDFVGYAALAFGDGGVS